MRKYKIVGVVFILLGALAVNARGQTVWYVAPTGNDQHPGTLRQPFQTVEKALERLKEAAQPADYRIILRGGTYRLTEPVRITASIGLTAASSLTLEAYPGEQPVLSGNRQVAGNWTKAGERLWKVKAAHRFNQLFIDGKRAIRSRYPNEGHWLEPDTIQLEANRLVFSESIPEAFGQLTTAELHITGFWHYIRQSVQRFDVQNSAVFTNQYPGPECSATKINRHDRGHFENSLLFVDTENEWFLDPLTQELFLFTENNPNSMHIEYPVLHELIRLTGTREQPLENISLKGITLTGTEWEMGAVERKGIQAGFWGTTRDKPVYAPGAAFVWEWVRNSQVLACTFQLLGEGAIALGNGCSQNQLVGNHFEDVGSNVVQIGYRPAYSGEGHPLHKDFTDAREVSHHNLVRYNHFKNFGTTDKGSVGIWVGYSHNNQIDHNLLEDFPYSGISVGWYWGDAADLVETNCHSNTIAWNEVRNGMKYLSDGAGIYLVGNQPGTAIRDNWVHTIGGGYSINSGIYVDEGGANMEITRNYFLDLTNPRESHAIKLHKNAIPTMRIYNNGGEMRTQRVVSPNQNYQAAQYADVKLAAPENPELYGKGGDR